MLLLWAYFASLCFNTVLGIIYHCINNFITDIFCTVTLLEVYLKDCGVLGYRISTSFWCCACFYYNQKHKRMSFKVNQMDIWASGVLSKLTTYGDVSSVHWMNVVKGQWQWQLNSAEDFSHFKCLNKIKLTCQTVVIIRCSKAVPLSKS